MTGVVCFATHVDFHYAVEEVIYMDMTGIDTAIIIAVVIAIVNRIKAEAPEIKGYWYTLMAFVIGAIVYAMVTFAPAMVTTIFFIGAAASGVYDIFKTS